MKVIKYEAQQDFSLISTAYSLDDEAISPLSLILSKDTLTILKNITPKTYESLHEFSQALLNNLGEELWQSHGEIICQYSNLGRRKFYDKLGWLFYYQHNIQIYAEMLTQIRSVQIQLKTQGLHSQSPQQWLNTISNHSLTPIGQKFQSQILEYLTFEANQVPVSQILLGTSDVIESLFGKYKFFTARRTIKDIGTNILLIPLFTLKITTSQVKKAMEAMSFIDVDSWVKSVFGSSMLSQRRTLSLATTPDTETA
ncbi:hypothetical protein ACE1AT_16660 [Pelatocladus sp. BLCC-F211]|uniref:hypothetical protein n=1 Tax=Pelatocladus sp. BLCC-F211 TaxID=3342752 RepID=UPI0035B9BC58